MRKRSPIKPVSDKQMERNRIWKEVSDERAYELNMRCEWCGRYGSRVLDDPWLHLDGHHIIKRRYRDDTKENCYICHRLPCHREIEDNNINVREYPNKGAWERRNGRK